MSTKIVYNYNQNRVGFFNSVQLNVILLVDVAKALQTGTMDGCVYMTDNNPDSTGKGSQFLKTVCKQGQVINFLVYSMNMQYDPVQQSYPPMATINNVVFTDAQTGEARVLTTMEELKIYGGVDKVRLSPNPPLSYYWAGFIPERTNPGLFPCRLVIYISYLGGWRVFNLDGPSLDVRAIRDHRIRLDTFLKESSHKKTDAL